MDSKRLFALIILWLIISCDLFDHAQAFWAMKSRRKVKRRRTRRRRPFHGKDNLKRSSNLRYSLVCKFRWLKIELLTALHTMEPLLWRHHLEQEKCHLNIEVSFNRGAKYEDYMNIYYMGGFDNRKQEQCPPYRSAL